MMRGQWVVSPPPPDGLPWNEVKILVVPQRLNPSDFGDHGFSPLAPLSSEATIESES